VKMGYRMLLLIQRYEGQVSPIYRGVFLALIAFSLLLPAVCVHNALARPVACQANGDYLTHVHTTKRHGSASRHHMPHAAQSKEAYYSQLTRSKSEWRQSQHRRIEPSPVRSASTNRGG
jgi:hypothetical protein